jgi:hypothetical protein
MKHTYFAPELELTILTSADVIATSLQDGGLAEHKNLPNVDFDGLSFQ